MCTETRARRDRLHAAESVQCPHHDRIVTWRRTARRRTVGRPQVHRLPGRPRRARRRCHRRHRLPRARGAAARQPGAAQGRAARRRRRSGRARGDDRARLRPLLQLSPRPEDRARHPRRTACGRLHRDDARLERGVLRRVREGARQLLRRQGVSGRMRHDHERARETGGQTRPRARRADDAPAAQALHTHRAHRHGPLRHGAAPGASRRLRRDLRPRRRGGPRHDAYPRRTRGGRTGATTSSSRLPATSSPSHDFRPELFAGDRSTPLPATPDSDQPA